MFSAAGGSLAPSHLTCRSQARLLGCRIMNRPFQRGLLQAVRLLVHPDGGRCDVCRRSEAPAAHVGDLFTDLLKTADQSRSRLLVRAMLDPMALRAFIK
jgi:hypothetical protein